MLLLLTLLLQDDPITAIETYRTSGGNHWLPPAAIAAEALEAGRWRSGHRSPSEFLASAASHAGYQVNSFRRQVRSASFLKAQLGDGFAATVQSAKAAVSAVEMLARLHQVNPDTADTLLEPVLQGQRGFVEIREIYQREARRGLPLRNSLRASVKTRSAEFQDVAKSCVLTHLPSLFTAAEISSVSMKELRHPLPLARLDFVLTGQDAKGASFAEAVDCRTIGVDNTRGTVIPLLQQSSLLALQFRRVWMAFPMQTLELEATAKVIDEFIGALRTLQLSSVGVLLLSEHAGTNRGKPELLVKHTPQTNAAQTEGQRLLLTKLRV